MSQENFIGLMIALTVLVALPLAGAFFFLFWALGAFDREMPQVEAWAARIPNNKLDAAAIVVALVAGVALALLP